MGFEQRLEVNDVSRALGQGLHDHQVFHTRQRDLESAQRPALATGYRVALKGQGAENEVDVDLRRLMS